MAELSLLKLCHGEKECHEMEQLREDKTRYACVLSFCKVNNKNNSFARTLVSSIPARVTWL